MSVKGKDVEVIEVDKSYKKNFSPGLYDLTELQRDANKIFGYSAKKTLSIMQRLYESHKVLTYPRTDSRYISSDIVDTLKDRIKACSVGPYAAIANKVLRNPIKANKAFVDDSKVSDHHAIIPTEQILPSINKGDIIKISSVMQTKGATKPPAPFNEGTLLSAMENPKKYMEGEDKALIKIIGETGGIRTVATRADIIEKLF